MGNMILAIDCAKEETGPWDYDSVFVAEDDVQAVEILSRHLFLAASEDYTTTCLAKWEACKDKTVGITMPNGLNGWDRFRIIH